MTIHVQLCKQKRETEKTASKKKSGRINITNTWLISNATLTHIFCGTSS